jgi:O-antigen/teichoic acid export membrane protein
MGSGLLLLSAANALYVLTGYVLTVGLARLLGPFVFGLYGVVAAVITILNMLVTRGVPIAASRAIASNPNRADVTVQACRRVMTVLVAGLMVTTVALAAPATVLMGDHRLFVPLLIAAFAVPTFGFNANLLSFVNGMGMFGRQAASQAAYAIGRLAAILGGATIAGLPGAIAGFAVAPLLGAIPLIGTRRTHHNDEALSVSDAAEDATPRSLFNAAVPMVITATMITLLMVIDLLAFKRVGASREVGIYLAAGTLAHVPYFLLQSSALVLLPRVASAPDIARKARVARGVLSDSVVLLALPTALLVAIGDRLVPMIFGEAFHSDAIVVAPLAVATAAVTLHAAFVAIDAALGRMREAVGIGCVGAAALAVAVTISGEGSDVGGAATAAAVVCAVVAVVHGALLWSRIGPLIHARTGIAVAAAAALALASRAAPHSFLGSTVAIIVSTALFGSFVGVAKLIEMPRTTSSAC